MENKDEIIINVKNPIKTKKKNKKVKAIKKKNNKIKNIKEVKNKKKKKITIKIVLILAFLITACILLASSEIFNIKKVSVLGLDKLSDKEIISYSNIVIGENIFKTNLAKAEYEIEKNPYVKTVEVKRKFPDTIIVNIEERKVKYILQLAESYIYVDSQGYILEISKEKKENPVLLGIVTDLSNVKAGDRLVKEDLLKFDKINEIVETCKNYEIINFLNKIDISDSSNYIIYLENENKTVHLGNGDDLNTRMLWLKSIIEQTKDKKGIIFLDMDLNVKKPYFRQEG